jgi:hypothetical protein
LNLVGHEGSDVSDEDGSDESSSSEEGDEDQSESASRSNEDVNLIDVKPSTAAGKPASSCLLIFLMFKIQEPLICSVCLNMRNVENDRVIQCDKLV